MAMRYRGWILLAAALVLGGGLVSEPAGAAEWGAITPGTTTTDGVRAIYGAPTKSTTQKVEGQDSAQWVYDGAQAPRGLKRMVVDFGILDKSGYHASLVRSLTIEPRPGAFDRRTILNGWGEPARVGREGQGPAFFYEQGLIVAFDKDGWAALSLVFMPPQPPSSAPAERKP